MLNDVDHGIDERHPPAQMIQFFQTGLKIWLHDCAI